MTIFLYTAAALSALAQASQAQAFDSTSVNRPVAGSSLAQGALSVFGISTDKRVNAQRREFLLSVFRFYRKCRNDLR